MSLLSASAGSRAVGALLLLSCGENAPPAAADAGAKPIPCTPFTMPADCVIPPGAVLPADLRCTGLYGDWDKRALACGVETYTPAYELWADGAGKQRYVALPEGGTIDVTDPDGFKYPVGTRFWKEFRLSGANGPRPGETRLMQKSDAGWIYTSYVWSEDGTTAIQNNDGVMSLFGSGHTVPARTQCKECHAGRPDYILGWDALMIAADGERAGLDLKTLEAGSRLTWKDKDTGAPSPLSLTITGDATERAALGYLHANCGISCHNDSAPALARETGLFLRLDAETLGSVQTTLVISTGVGRKPSPNAPITSLPVPPSGSFVDVSPTQPDRSLILARMKVRGTEAQMPRQATNVVDAAGVGSIESFIAGMTVARGYPPPSAP